MSREKHLEALREHSPALQALHQREQDAEKATKEMTTEQVAEILGTTIKHDKTSKTLVFYGTILNYTEEDQQNFSSNGPSAVGKSWIVSETLEYFPAEDILSKGYTSPTAFWHINSELCRADGEPLDNRDRYVNDGINHWEELNPLPPKGEGRENWKEKRKTERRRIKAEWDEIDKYYIVNLEGKILHFRDQPHDKLLQNLRPVLSHDNKIIELNITDKTREGGHRTKKVLVIGYPTVHFNSVRFSLDEQERTRLWLTSPEITQEKFKDTLKQQSVSLANRDAFKEELRRNEKRRLLQIRVRLIKESPVKEVIIKPEAADAIYMNFLEEHPTLTPRHQRDFPRLIAMIKAHALFNQWTREHSESGTTIYANSTDIEEGPKLCKDLIESNELGLPPHVYRYYEEMLRPELNANPYGLHKTDLSRLYFEFYNTRIGKKPLENMIDLLLETGLMIEDIDPDDKRRKKLYPPALGGKKSGKPEEEPPGADEDKLLDDIAEFFTLMGESQVDQNHLYAHIEKRHRLTRDEFASMLKGWPELFDLDGWTVSIKDMTTDPKPTETEIEKDGLQHLSKRFGNGEKENLNDEIRELTRFLTVTDEALPAEDIAYSLQWTVEKTLRILGTTDKDGTTFQPRLGYWRLS